MITNNKNSFGFTFVELLVVITIIGIIFASGIVAFTSITTRSRDTRRKADLEAIRQSLEMCRSLVSYYPDEANVYQSDPTNSTLGCTGTGPILMSKTPTEPRSCASGLTGGMYAYTKTGATTYTLSAPCMELDSSYQVTNP